jgi:hypothetical protein
MVLLYYYYYPRQPTLVLITLHPLKEMQKIAWKLIHESMMPNCIKYTYSAQNDKWPAQTDPNSVLTLETTRRCIVIYMIPRNQQIHQ